MTFNHEKFEVYQRILAFNARVSAWIVGGDTGCEVRNPTRNPEAPQF